MPREDYRKVDAVAEQITRAAEYVAAGAAAEYREQVEYRLSLSEDDDWCPRLESPLEAIFYVWWLASVPSGGHPWKYCELEAQRDVVVEGERFRLDFVVTLRPCQLREAATACGLAFPLIGVEVDGHGFHERTRDQVELRNRRDRLLQKAGWHIFHYSWGELVKTPAQSVGEVYAFAVQSYWDLQKRVTHAA